MLNMYVIQRSRVRILPRSEWWFFALRCGKTGETASNIKYYITLEVQIPTIVTLYSMLYSIYIIKNAWIWIN